MFSDVVMFCKSLLVMWTCKTVPFFMDMHMLLQPGSLSKFLPADRAVKKRVGVIMSLDVAGKGRVGEEAFPTCPTF